MSHRRERNIKRKLEQNEYERALAVAEEMGLNPDMADDPAYRDFERRMDAFFERHPDLDTNLWLIHFGGITEEATCDDCLDYECGCCPGGGNPLECMTIGPFGPSQMHFVSSEDGR